MKSILEKIPKFKCKEGCSDCCIDKVLECKIDPDGGLLVNGPWHRIGKFGTVEQFGKCVRASSVGCSIYKDRGFLCRLYGASEALPDCPHGYGASKKLTIEETKEIVRQFDKSYGLDCPIKRD